MNETLPIAVLCIFLFLSAVYHGLLYLGRKKEEIQARFSIAQAAAMPGFRKSLPDLQKEVTRARRSERPLSVVVVRPLRDNRSDADQLSRIDFLLCGRIFRDAARQLDFTTYDAALDRFVIVLPETTKAQAIQTINRFAGLVGKTFDQLSFSTAVFPEDGLAIEDLIARAEAPGGGTLSHDVDDTVTQAQSYASH